MTFANVIHNSIIHPLMPLAEMLSRHGWKKPAVAIWKWHEGSRDDLREFEKWYAFNEKKPVKI
jgi:hypothetical protein